MMNSLASRYWVSVVSREHILKGKEWGIIQVCHGKAAPLRRMKAGDWIVNYSSVESLQTKEKCQKFTALARIKTGKVYQVDMGEGFQPFRLDAEFFPCRETPIHPLISELSFIKNSKQWGYPFRFGHFEIPAADFELISKNMAARPG